MCVDSVCNYIVYIFVTNLNQTFLLVVTQGTAHGVSILNIFQKNNYIKATYRRSNPPALAHQNHTF